MELEAVTEKLGLSSFLDDCSDCALTIVGQCLIQTLGVGETRNLGRVFFRGLVTKPRRESVPHKLKFFVNECIKFRCSINNNV